jgi:UDP-glucuronate 4-epimerase
MAMFIFAKAILGGRSLPVFNDGRMRRDFTYIDDVVDAVVRISNRAASPDPQWDSARPDPASSRAPFKIYNVGNSEPVEVMRVIAALERLLGRKAILEMLPMQPGDVPATFADVEDLARDAGFLPATPIENGIERFVAWYRDYYKV